MTKQTFLDALKNKLTPLPEKDIEQYIEYYSEIIDDMTEDGSSEEEAVASIGSVDDIAEQILDETSHTDSSAENSENKRNYKVWEIILIALGFPIWFSLLAAAFAVAVSLLAAVFSVIISLYAVVLALGVAAVLCIPAAITLFIQSNFPGGLLLLGSGLICAGIAILLFIGTNKLTKFSINLLKNIFRSLKSRLSRKERSK